MIKIGGLQKLTLIDYPSRVACTVFLVGCNFKCPWCYNSQLVTEDKASQREIIPEDEFFAFLKQRQGFLEGVVVCGGEPTMYEDLPQFIKKIKNLKYLVKLDTNGSNPSLLKNLIEEKLIDYVAMDVKLPKERYKEVFKNVSVNKIEQSIKILKKSNIDFELRTTVVPKVLTKKDIIEITKWITALPPKEKPLKYFLQDFKPKDTIDKEFEKLTPYPREYLLEIQRAISPFFEVCGIR